MECLTSNERLGVCGVADITISRYIRYIRYHDADSGILRGISPLRNRDNCANFVDSWKNCRRFFTEFFWEVLYEQTIRFWCWFSDDFDPGIFNGIFTAAG